MKNRSVEFPGRMKMTDVSTGDEFIFDVVRAEGTVTQAGTPYNVANVLADETAVALGLTSTATPNDAFAKIAEQLASLPDSIKDDINENLAGAFEDDATYLSGEYVINDGHIYRFDTDHDAGDWDESEVTQVTAMGEVENKVDKIQGKGLSTNDFTDAEQEKLGDIEEGAQANVQADWGQSDSSEDDYIKNKPEHLVQDADYVHTDSNFTATEKTKLRDIAEGAEVNQNAFAKVKAGSTTIEADEKSDTLEIAAGSNVTIEADDTNDKVTISATDTTYSDATQSAHGLMSATDKKKLDRVAVSYDAANKKILITY